MNPDSATTSSSARTVTGYRTRLRPGAADEYRALHARVPEVVAGKLRAGGVLDWTIWIDGDTLFHTIETDRPFAAALAALDALGPVDPAWDDAIARLVDAHPDSAALLPRVWALDESGSGPAATVPTLEP